jgi:carboxylesterase
VASLAIRAQVDPPRSPIEGIIGATIRPVTEPSPPLPTSPIAWGEGDCGVLLLHGLTGTPYDLRFIAEVLRDEGYAVRVPRLAGHESVDTLECSTWREWYASAERALDELASASARVIVLGFSLGGLLALRLAALRGRQLRGVIVMSVPLAFEGWQVAAIEGLARLRRVRALRKLVGVWPKKHGPDIRIVRELEKSPSLRAFPFPTLAQLVDLQREVAPLLYSIHTPLLLIHGKYDHTAPIRHSRTVAQRVASNRVEVVIVPGSFHLLGLDVDRDVVAQNVVGFCRSIFHTRDAEGTSP